MTYEFQWRIDEFKLPEIEDELFFKKLESNNLPFVCRDLNEKWPALRKWAPHSGGLNYLKEVSGEVKVQVMISSSESLFYGAIGSHERSEVLFKDILDLAIEWLNKNDPTTHKELIVQASNNPEGDSNEDETIFDPLHIYLAQAPIMDKGKKNSAGFLSSLIPDIQPIPKCLPTNSVKNVNLWMSINGSRSSIHYDPFHNLLCPIVGTKTVTLWPPSSTPNLYPMPLYGEAPNHSGVDFANPDYGCHPAFKQALGQSQACVLGPSDALFIPEGWWHQVDSQQVSIAVNMWYSHCSLACPEEEQPHMDAYMLRKYASSLLDQKRRELVLAVCPKRKINGPGIGDLSPLQKTPEEAKAFSLRELVLAIDDLQREKSEPPPAQKTGQPAETKQKVSKIEQVLSSLDAISLKQVLLSMAVEFPSLLRVWIMEDLTAMAAEILTLKFEQAEEMPRESEEQQLESFYEIFYSVFDDQNEALKRILQAKEEFGRNVLDVVIRETLGSNS